MGMDPDKAIGIDLGTTYSCVAVWQNGKAEVIANDQGNRTTPSMVAFTSQERLLGEGAKNQVALNPKNTVFDVKRLIGRRFSEPTVQRDVELWPFKVVADDMGQPLVEVEFKGELKRFPPQQICSMILEKMKKIAEDYLHSSVRNAVITVPAYFNDAQRKATQDAATIAGLNAIRIINEPSAAAIAYGFRPDAFTSDTAKTILVFDLGGGTFDVSIVSLHNGVFQVKGVGGDMHLGGEDVDNNLLDFCVAQFKRRNKGADTDIKNNAKAMRRLRTECERAKRTLSSAVETVIDIDALHEGNDFKSRMSKAKFDELNSHLFERCIQIVSSSIAEAGMAADQIDEIVLVGGSSRIPHVRELLEELFPGRSLCRQLNPDEAIAMGAAIQAASLNNEGVELVLTDVTPLSLGVSINGGMMNVVVPRNTPVPAQKERSYTTRYDGQTELVFPVYEGERALVQDNNLIGEFRLAGVPWGPAGSADIRVTFRIDEDGILTVSARERKSGVNSEITIAKCSGRLSPPRIEKMVKDAEMFRRDDDEARRRLAARNSVETLVNNMKGRLRHGGVKEQLGLQAAEQIYEELQSAQLWLDETDDIPTAELEQMFQALRAICRPVSLQSKPGK